MLHRTLAVTCLALVFAAAGCDTRPTHESIRKDAVAKMKEIVAIMKDVKDEKSAKAARPKLEAAKKELDAMKAEDDALPKISAEEDKRLDDKYNPEVEKVMKEIMTEGERISKDPKLAAEVADVFPS
jgi:hypothetical protein